MASYLRPRRGKKSTALNQNIILKRGEVFFEVPEAGVGKGLGKIKMGDGVTTYDKLPYFNDSSKLGSDTVGSASKPIYLKDGVPTAITNSIGNAASKGVANNLTQASAGTNVLDAYQGKVLDDKITTLNNSLKSMPNVQFGIGNTVNGHVRVTFEKPFSKIPIVTTGYNGSSTGNVVSIKIDNITINGFDAYSSNVSGNVSATSTVFYWIAISE